MRGPGASNSCELSSSQISQRSYRGHLPTHKSLDNQLIEYPETILKLSVCHDWPSEVDGIFWSCIAGSETSKGHTLPQAPKQTYWDHVKGEVFICDSHVRYCPQAAQCQRWISTFSWNSGPQMPNKSNHRGPAHFNLLLKEGRSLQKSSARSPHFVLAVA